MRSWKQVLVQKEIETLDDSKDGINLLMKQNLTCDERAKKYDFRAVIAGKKLETIEETTEEIKAQTEFKPNQFGRKRATAVKPEVVQDIDPDDDNAQLDGTFVSKVEIPNNDSTIPLEFDDTSRKRPIFDEDTNSKRPKISFKGKGKRNKMFFMYDNIGNWASDTDDSMTGMSMSRASRPGASNLAPVLEHEECEAPPAPEETEAPKITEEQLNKYFHKTEPDVKPMEELTPLRLEKREEQIRIGKDTPGYINYRKFHPKTNEKELEAMDQNAVGTDKFGRLLTVRKDQYSVDVFPTTPRKDASLSKRQWDVVIRRWRRSLHMYDDITNEEDFKKITETEKENLEVKILQHKKRSSRKSQPVRNGFKYKHGK